MLMRQSSPATSSECSGDDGFDCGCGRGGGDDANNARGELAKEFGPPEASSWCTTARAPKAGERVQVFGCVISVWYGVGGIRVPLKSRPAANNNPLFKCF